MESARRHPHPSRRLPLHGCSKGASSAAAATAAAGAATAAGAASGATTTGATRARAGAHRAERLTLRACGQLVRVMLLLRRGGAMAADGARGRRRAARLQQPVDEILVATRRPIARVAGVDDDAERRNLRDRSRRLRTCRRLRRRYRRADLAAVRVVVAAVRRRRRRRIHGRGAGLAPAAASPWPSSVLRLVSADDLLHDGGARVHVSSCPPRSSA